MKNEQLQEKIDQFEKLQKIVESSPMAIQKGQELLGQACSGASATPTRPSAGCIRQGPAHKARTPTANQIGATVA